MDHNLQIVVILTVGFSLASLLGFLTQKAKLPTIFGYLLAGYMIGPFSPGYVADLRIAEQLAEIGIILMLFGVGLHFKVQDLVKVKNIAIPGALGQTLVTTLIGTLFVHYIGWPLEAGIIIGLAIAVASTVVLVHVLTEKRLLDTLPGHIAIGWLVVEDIFTVAVLILLPILPTYFNGESFSIYNTLIAISVMLGKFIFVAVVMFIWGHKVVEYILTNVARLRSNELLTLTVLAVTFAIATAISVGFGMSIALGAFIAGMVIGQTNVRHQASATSMPLKDVFAVIFFLSVGMLFNPMVIITNFSLFAGVLAIVLLIKPLVAFFLVLLFKCPLRTALTVAIALAQIGEFSFILAEEAMRYQLLPDEGYDVIVTCALISISINPLLFNSISFLEGAIQKIILGPVFHLQHVEEHHKKNEDYPTIVLVGFGPIGQAIFHFLEKQQNKPIVIEQNIDTVTKMRLTDLPIIYGDASHTSILEAAHIATASIFIITVPETEKAISIINTVRQLRPDLTIVSRVTYQSEIPTLEKMNVTCVCSETETLNRFLNEISAHISTENFELAKPKY